MLEKKDLPEEWMNTIDRHVKALKLIGAEEVWLVGSRANGNYRDDSDFDYTTTPAILLHSKEIDVIMNFRGHSIKLT